MIVASGAISTSTAISTTCADTGTGSATLHVRHTALFLPSAFLPGEEGNSTFGPEGGDLARFDLSVYDRQGRLVFRSSDPALRWDGHGLHGEECPQGSYVYVLRYALRHAPSAPPTLTGSVLLLR